MVDKTSIYDFLHEDQHSGGALYTHCRHVLRHGEQTFKSGEVQEIKEQKEQFQSITSNNKSEFMVFDKIEEALKMPVYSARA